MKKAMRLCALLVLLCLTAGCGAGASESGGQSVQMFAVNVGKGDAIIIKVDNWCGLIDAGKPKAMSRIRAALRSLNIAVLDAVFLTHTDNDHAGGMAWLSESGIPVGAWYAPAMYTGVKAKKHPMALAAAARGADVRWLKRGDTIALGDTGAALRVLAPATLFEDKDDNNSLVMMLETAQGKMLLTGDMELPEEADLLTRGDDLRCAVLKAPNHGDDDTLSERFADACRAQIAVISTDSQEKPGTPDPEVVARLNAVGTTCCVTQDAALGISVTLADGQAEAQYVGIDAPATIGVSIVSVTPGEDTVTLQNTGAALDMTGWSLHSDRGDELYPFPDGWTFPANSTVTVGTNSTDGTYDLLWDDKKVIHKSKTDNITLYDNWGRAVDAASNGK